MDERFWSMVEIGEAAACWPWRGSKGRRNYGKVKRRGHSIAAHRYAYQLTRGAVLTSDQVHLCDNPPCCNPDHLLPGTAADNSQDMIAKGRAAWQRPGALRWLQHDLRRWHAHVLPRKARPMSEPRTAASQGGAAMSRRAKIHEDSGLPMSLWESLDNVSRDCGYPTDILNAIEDEGFRLVPWRSESEPSVLGALKMLVTALNEEPARTFSRRDNGESWSRWFNDRFVPAWSFALMASGLYKSDPSLRHFNAKDRGIYLSAMTEERP